MVSLASNTTELKMTVEIIRKETGLTETVELVGMADEEQLKALLADGLVTPTEKKDN
jgi:biotin synthase-like enzyme